MPILWSWSNRGAKCSLTVTPNTGLDMAQPGIQRPPGKPVSFPAPLERPQSPSPRPEGSAVTSAGGSPEQGDTTCTSHLGPSARHEEVSGHPGTASGCPNYRAAQVVLVVKNPPANAGDARDPGLIPELGRSLEEGMATRSSIVPMKAHGQRHLVGYSSWGR